MVARLTRFLLLLQLLFAGLIAFALVRVAQLGPLTSLLFALLIVLSVRMAITANNFHLSWTFRSETPEAFVIGPARGLKLFLQEFMATMISSSWTMPFCTFWQREGNGQCQLPVLLVHGYGCNSGYWHFLSKALQKAGITHYALDLEPVAASIDTYVPLIHRGIDAICQATRSPRIIIVAHSMGGLAARAYLKRWGAGRVARLVTLGSPHNGTGIARFGVGENCRQMEWQRDGVEGASSAWLRALANAESEETRAIITSIYSHHDNIISPQTSSHLAGARNIELHGIGHVALGLMAGVHECVIDEIREASCSAAIRG
ncbi:alpha/beta hydrolase fold [Noviherbaspirillum humi]|uniref:Alpha/beta hydrolase fold n=1 Tax=Noviherbaspirillum humi TaxID=1688639 RepID=A0A239KTG5_9BURK|nr:alpha/beta fold hydrolase [Noviherbaspirillum humi]SNT20968.1 alpha/beta hydrolase fold [Noviherbaspirillum humi]